MLQVDATQQIPIKMWVSEIEEEALQQAKNLANLPFAFKHIALMPDCHSGYGMPIGGVVTVFTKLIVSCKENNMNVDRLNRMQMFEELAISVGNGAVHYGITRVPGGFVYKIWNVDTQIYTSMVFVPEVKEPQVEISNLTNSEKGSVHWINSLLANIIHCNEALSEYVNDTAGNGYVKAIEQASREIEEFYNR